MKRFARRVLAFALHAAGSCGVPAWQTINQFAMRLARICIAVLLGSASTAHAAGIVGTGSAASCTDAALDAALAGGGLVTFDCSGPTTIDVSTGTGTKTIGADTTVDGGGLVTISGRQSVGVFFVNSGVNLTVKNLTIADGVARLPGRPGFNTAGGGINNNGGMLTVASCTFERNQTSGGAGGGIYNSAGTLVVTDSTFIGNRARGASGGAIYNDLGTLTVTDTTFSGNVADHGGGIVNAGDMLTVTNCTFTENSATVRQGDGGGGDILIYFGPATVTNSTFTKNAVVGGNGGGIDNSGETLIVTNSTFTGNSAVATVFPPGGGIGGGVATMGGTTVLRNTIVANSPSGDNCSDFITDGGHNLEDGTTCGFSTANGSFSNTDPHLDPAGLRSNGGPTQTVALCTGVDEPAGCAAASPAVDGGDQAVCAAVPVNNRDQRGFVRPGADHANCSIGAYEADLTQPQATATPTDTATSVFTATPTQMPTTGACTGDCDGNDMVAIDELVLGVNIVLGPQLVDACPAFANSQGTVDVAQLIEGVNNALKGCGLG